MSADSDVAQDMKALDALNKEERAARKDKNRQVFANHGFHTYDHQDQVLIRIKGKPRCDYYLTKNKWKGERNKIHYGDAMQFFTWFAGEKI